MTLTNTRATTGVPVILMQKQKNVHALLAMMTNPVALVRQYQACTHVKTQNEPAAVAMLFQLLVVSGLLTTCHMIVDLNRCVTSCLFQQLVLVLQIDNL